MNNFNDVIRIIDANDNFVILSHKKPDGDAIGSSIAMCELLIKLGKNACIIQNDKFPYNLEFLKNEFFYSNVRFDVDVCICLDSADITRVSDRHIYKDSITLNIDHHETNTNYGDVNYVNSNSSSTGEILYDICRHYNIFTERIYRSIYVAIATDTNRLYYSNSKYSTALIISEIFKNLDNVYYINRLLYGSVPLSKVKLNARAIEKAEFYFDNKLAVTFLSESEQLEIGSSDTDNIVENLRDINNVEVSILLYHYKGNLKVSLRSKNYVDVSRIAKKFGGGGHKRAAGISLGEEDIIDFKNTILGEFSDVWNS